MSSPGPRSPKSNENVLLGDTPTSVNPEARCGATHSTRNTVGRHPSELSPAIGEGPSEVSLGSAYWGGDAERIPGDIEYANATARPCPLCDTGMVRIPARVSDSICPRLLYQTQKLAASIQRRQLRIGLPMIAIGGAPQRVVTKIGRQLGLLWIFGWKLPFFRMQSGRGHNCLTKLLERNLCFVCALRSFF